ncbi:leucyl/phenylalanyl-tRNA--protein transferase [Paracoccus aurantiacus]|uniref:Leucyl/phenylalanyl-tRNA--protein transferase n=2 Tax=Paracoccus aurantiacus TaxID=2599412 RepID=A0A5C6S4J5_9RHOB|nr:leucyl/phenylalanyl-tRNA--protein transferase [Paracoccus aurantiacus]TXB69379.1 leucyl/phenylalanyl-tRNA--protein transferase [Paracoccus aurantiacus]
MLWGYANGIFPMAVSASDPSLHWFDPPQRGILPIGGLHVSRSMRRHLRGCGWRLALNTDFAAVVDSCAARPETWINAPLQRIYAELHDAGRAHSLEAYDGSALVGGIFGLSIGGAFFGESMFSRAGNGSKAALLALSAHLANCGFLLFDTQYPTPHLQSLGGLTISRAEYHRRLTRALAAPADITRRPLPDIQAISQLNTQTS